MSPLDNELRAALRRVEPPAGFAGRTMARVRAHRRAALMKRWAAAAIAAVLLLSFGAERYHEQQQGMRAKRELMTALRITSDKLALAERKVSEIQIGAANE